MQVSGASIQKARQWPARFRRQDRGDHRGDGLGLGQVRWPDAGDAQLADQPGVAQLGQRAEMLGDRIGGVGAEVHQVEVVAAELAQVLLDLAAQLPGGGPGQPPPDGSRPGPTLVAMTRSSG